MGEDDPANADATLDEYLKQPELTDAERAWALDQRAGILIDEKNFAQAKKLLADSLRLNSDPVDQGQVNFQLGYCALRENQIADAERYFRLSRDQLRVQHPLDGEAAYYLGEIYENKNDPMTAISFYEVVLTSHPESRLAPLSRLGRGVCRIMLGQTDAGLTDLHDLTAEIDRRASRSKFKPEAIKGLQTASAILAGREDYQAAMEVVAYEQTLEPSPGPAFFGRLGQIYEKRALQLESSLADAMPADKIARQKQIRELRTKAGDAYVIQSNALTIADDKGYADAMWKGVDLYDSAGNVQSVISALELFAAERPEDRMAPDALLRLGQAYQAAGLFDKAIDAYQRNQFRYPKSLAASKSAVPLAKAYIAKGPEQYPKAEKTLLGVVENNPLIDPGAEEFRQSLFELAQLYYRTGRYEEAVARLEEVTERYPKDDKKPQLVFLMADSYRKSATLLDVKLASAQPATGVGATDVAEAVAAKKQRLVKAHGLYDQVIDLYRAAGPSSGPGQAVSEAGVFLPRGLPV